MGVWVCCVGVAGTVVGVRVVEVLVEVGVVEVGVGMLLVL